MPTERTSRPLNDVATIKDGLPAEVAGITDHPKSVVYRDVRLGDVEFAVWDEMRRLYEERSTPIPSVVAAQIVRKHSKAENPYSMLNVLERKGVLESGSNRRQDRPRMPVTGGIRIILGASKLGRVVWPHVATQSVTRKRRSADTISTITKLITEPKRIGGNGPYVAPASTPVIKMTARRVRLYEALMQAQRQLGYSEPLSPQMLAQIVRACKENSSNMFSLDHRFGLTVQIGTLGCPQKRFVVFASYRNTDTGETITPNECTFAVNDSASTPVPTSPTTDTGAFRSKQELAAEIRELHEKVRSGAQTSTERELRETEGEIGRIEGRMDELRQDLGELEGSLQARRRKHENLQEQLDGIIAGSVPVEPDAQTQDRIRRLEFLIENYDLLVKQ